MLERGADDVAADMAAGRRAAEQREIVGFGGAGGKNQFFRQYAKQRRNMCPRVGKCFCGGLPGGMSGIRIAGVIETCAEKGFGDAGVCRSICAVIEINHKNLPKEYRKIF